MQSTSVQHFRGCGLQTNVQTNVLATPIGVGLGVFAWLGKAVCRVLGIIGGRCTKRSHRVACHTGNHTIHHTKPKFAALANTQYITTQPKRECNVHQALMDNAKPVQAADGGQAR
jgi:hypothetical protein